MSLKICILILKTLNQRYLQDNLEDDSFNLNLFKI